MATGRTDDVTALPGTMTRESLTKFPSIYRERANALRLVAVLPMSDVGLLVLAVAVWLVAMTAVRSIRILISHRKRLDALERHHESALRSRASSSTVH